MGDRVRLTNLVPATDLTPDRAAWLTDGLTAALPGLKMRELFARRIDMFSEADLITVAVAEPGGGPVGALSSRWVTLASGERFLHVMTQFVGDRYRHRAVFAPSWAAHLARMGAGPEGFPAVTVLKTYNPLVFCSLRTLSRIEDVRCYPSVAGTGDPRVAGLAGRIADAIAPGHPFDPATGVIRGIGVPRDLYAALPNSSDPLVNRYFAERTRPGDRVLCMLLVPTRQAAQTVLRVFSRVPARD